MAHMRIKLTQQGIDLRRVSPATQPYLEEAASESTDDLRDTARRLVPKRTRQLEKSIDAEMESPLRGQVTAGMPYWSFVEYGTRYMAAQPYLRPAQAEVRPRAIQRVKEAIEKGKRDA